MRTKYERASVITNDLFCAAYLLSVGCSIETLIHNKRKRISFVVAGDEVEEFRNRYKDGSVLCNLRSLRDNVTFLRQMMKEKRSNECPRSQKQLLKL